MNTARPTLMLASALMLMLGAASPAHAQTFTGRGIYAIDSASGCPFAEADAKGCNRIAVDDRATRVSVDRATGNIRWHNSKDYDDKTVLGDVLLQGSADSEDGRRVSVSFHMVISKEGQDWKVSRHVHSPVLGRFRNVRMDAYTVEAGTDAKEPLLTPAQLFRLMEQPGLSTRIAEELVEIRDSRGADHAPDITIALGRSPAAVPVLRARLLAPASSTSIPAMLQQESWSVELQALSGKIPTSVLRRELFLYGLDRVPMLQTVMKHGLAKRESLVIGAHKGEGYLSFGGKRQAFAQAAQVNQRYLQQSFVGIILGTQQLERGLPNAH